MGKRDRRRKRERAKASGAASAKAAPAPKAPPRILYPGAENPLVELHIDESADDETRALCRAYWEFAEPGVWARHVSAIGTSTTQVYKAVSSVAHASLLTVLCPTCTAPVTVTNRSQMAATGHWGPDMPVTPVEAASVCADCLSAERAARQQEAAQAKELEAERTKRRVDNAGAWLDREMDREFSDEWPDTMAALALLAATEIMEKTGTTSIGPLEKLDYTLTGTAEGDIAAFRELHQKAWAVPTLPATTGNFAYNDDDSVSGVYITVIPWTVPRWMNATDAGRRRYAKVAMQGVLERQPEAVRAALIEAETNMGIEYLNGLLTRKYGEEPVPEHRLPEAYAAVKDALVDGFTLEQVVAVAWSATAGSVAWGQRTPGLKAGAVSAATVTNLVRRIGYAKDRPVPEYEVPNWVSRPAVRSAALRLLAKLEATDGAMRRFRDLQQRVNSRQPEELAADLTDEQSVSIGDEFDRFVDEIRSGGKPDNSGAPLSYALVQPDGTFEIRSGTPAEMRACTSLPGSGFVDRIMIDGTQTVNAYVGELVPATTENDNRIGVAMLRLLGVNEGPLFGPISFFGVTRANKKPRGLDDEHQELLKAAHEAAIAKTL